MLTVDLREMSDSKCREVIIKCIETFKTERLVNREIFVIYNDLEVYDNISKQIAEIKIEYQFDRIRSVFMR